MNSNKIRIVFNCPVKIAIRLKQQSIELTCETTKLSPSDIMENCIVDLCKEKIKPKTVYNKDLIRKEFFISEPTRLKLKAMSMDTGYTMTELIIMAYEKYNPDVSDEYNHLKE